MPIVYVLLGTIVCGLICVLVKLSTRLASIKGVQKHDVYVMMAADTCKYTCAMIRNIVVFNYIRPSNQSLDRSEC